MARTKQSVIESESKTSKTSKVASKKETVKASKAAPKKEVVKATAPKKETKVASKKEDVKTSKVPPKKETKVPAKKETKVSTKKEVVKTSKVDLEALEKRLEACEKAIKLAVEEAAFVRKALDNVKDDKSELVEDTTETTTETTAEATTEATTEVSDESEKKVDVKTLKKPELISKLLELGIKEADVKRVDGNKGKPTIADFRAALEKAQYKNAKKDSKPKETLPKKKEEKAPKKVEKEKVSVDIDLKKGYGTDKDGFVYTLTKPRQVVAKLVKDKPIPLTAADMGKLKKLDIPHEKKTAPELKKLLVPLSDESEEDISEVAGRSGTEGTTETTMSSLEDSSESDSSESLSSESSSLADSSDESEPTPKKEKKKEKEVKTKVEKKKPSVKVVEESESTVANTEEDKVVDVTEKEVADDKAEGIETVKADDSSSSSSSSEDAEEGAEIAKHFEKVPEITENDFKKVVVAVHKKDINLEDSVKVNAEKLGMDQAKVGQIISKYNHFSSKWPAVIQAAKNTTKPTTTNKPGARQLLKPRK